MKNSHDPNQMQNWHKSLADPGSEEKGKLGVLEQALRFFDKFYANLA